MRRSIRLFAAMIVGVAPAYSCRTAEPRGETVVYVQTDLPLPRFADTLRIEHLDTAGRVVDRFERVLPSRSDWPTSFAVAAGGTARLRLRLYSARRVALLSLRPDGGSLDTDGLRPEFAIDRVVEIAPPSTGVARVAVTLWGACLGAKADPTTGSSCDAAAGSGPSVVGPTAGIVSVDRALGPADAIPVWSEAFDAPCTTPARADSPLRDGEVCLPGGMFFLGDVRLIMPEVDFPSFPERLVRLSPFLMDRYEVTVGRVRAAIAKGWPPPEGSHLTAADNPGCAFKDDGSRDDYPMNCLRFDFAASFCKFVGGGLPSEAQWEYAASGRGQERLFPWGDAPEPTCAAAVYARYLVPAGSKPALGSYNECNDGALPPIRVAERDADPRNLDLTLDGLRGMAGSMSEWVSDVPSPLAEGFWARTPLPKNPVCTEGPSTTRHMYKGGSWLKAASRLAVSNRFAFEGDPNDFGKFMGNQIGFRCARAAGGGAAP